MFWAYILVKYSARIVSFVVEYLVGAKLIQKRQVTLTDLPFVHPQIVLISGLWWFARGVAVCMQVLPSRLPCTCLADQRLKDMCFLSTTTESPVKRPPNGPSISTPKFFLSSWPKLLSEGGEASFKNSVCKTSGLQKGPPRLRGESPPQVSHLFPADRFSMRAAFRGREAALHCQNRTEVGHHTTVWLKMRHRRKAVVRGYQL